MENNSFKIKASVEKLSQLCNSVLHENGFTTDNVEAISDFIVSAEVDGCKSHGIYRLIGIIDTLVKGGINPKSSPVVENISNAALRVDSDGGLSPLAFMKGADVLKEKALENGIAVMAINNCVHATALWVEAEILASAGLASLLCNPTQSYVAPYGGSRPLLGTNPLAFGWPRKDNYPFVFDFATSAIARGDIELHELAGELIPSNWGVDGKGQATTDPSEVLKGGAMLPFGEHKGSALSIMIELIAGPLIGDLMSFESSEHDKNRGCLPYHGELVVAFNPSVLSNENEFSRERRVEQFFKEIEAQGARLPSSRRYLKRESSRIDEVDVDKDVFLKVKSLTKIKCKI